MFSNSDTTESRSFKMDILRSIKKWASSKEAVEKNTKNRDQREPTAKGLEKVELRVMKENTHHAPKRKRVEKNANLQGSNNPKIKFEKPRSDELIRVEPDGDSGFFEPDFGSVYLHKSEIHDNKKPIQGEKYWYQLNEGKDGELIATSAIILDQKRTDKVKTVNKEKYFAILEIDKTRTVLLNQNQVKKGFPSEGEQYSYTLSVSPESGKLKALNASKYSEHDLYNWAYIPLNSSKPVSQAIKQLSK